MVFECFTPRQKGQRRIAPAVEGAGNGATFTRPRAAATPQHNLSVQGETNTSFTFALYPVYLRGDAYLAAKQGTAAVNEFQKILDHTGVVGNEPLAALAHLGLGRAHSLAGDSAKSKTAYQDFFALWKDADPEIPILKEAKAEYAKLQ
jgi:hypothetical protein